MNIFEFEVWLIFEPRIQRLQMRLALQLKGVISEIGSVISQSAHLSHTERSASTRSGDDVRTQIEEIPLHSVDFLASASNLSVNHAPYMLVQT